MSAQIVEPDPATNNVVVGAVAHAPHNHTHAHAEDDDRPVKTRERYVDWSPACVQNEEPAEPPQNPALRFPSTRGPGNPRYERPRQVRHLDMPAAGGWLQRWMAWFDWKRSLLLLSVALVTALVISLVVARGGD